MKSAPQYDYKVTWLPFLLNPNSSKEPINKLEFYKQKFGAERIGPMFERMKSVGKEDGIDFNYDGLTGTTVPSHRLIDFAKRNGKQDQVVEYLFKAYFEDAKTIQSLDVLCSIAEQAGLPKDEVRSYLESDEGSNEIKSQASLLAQKYHCTGVPFFIINDKYSFSGAQDPDLFVSVFNKP
mmetsp:Transcript_38388/g.53420  ORF Transcript_38388/g.53420 Transcript_38388/m.53420 type:complete len:180 (+) Transcript_38388:115-654(+)|eukprot:CAMPEP_0201485388 /NCGR_PEP_ID=MMETSP0151_2-20130828/9500_1 /ASSEMBLY_ACC=CAM_ASM_000257 /TAXON_ID=200890 /ORGANISM="Paramoeba atlantica, Strain 621/1 / CCAP 1560/9" /LENGTH=179 /DNA_ID=CAMNT_0047869499 /DNA_START=175 /DNA_END=714 /DNA_ORIENTATION=-